MSSFEDARIAIVTAIEAAKATWNAYPLIIQYDNRNIVNVATQANPYLNVTIIALSGAQLDLADKPFIQQIGQIHLEACVRKSQGKRPANELLEHFIPALELRDDLNLVRTHAAFEYKARDVQDWYCCPILVPFWYLRTKA